MRRYLPVAALLLAWAGTAHARGLLIPDDKTRPAAGDAQPQGDHRHRGSGRRHPRRADLPQPHRPAPRSHLRLPRAQGRQRQQVHHVGRRQGSEGRDSSRPPRPARSTPTSSAAPRTPACWSTSATTCCSSRSSRSRPTATRRSPSASPSVAANENGIVEYIYPLKTDGKATATLEDFSIKATIKSQHAIQNVYSPTHAITLKRTNDNEVTVSFDKNQALARQGFPALLLDRRQGRGPDDADASADRQRRTATSRMLISPEGGDAEGASRCRATWCSCWTPPAACAASRWSRPARR